MSSNLREYLDLRRKATDHFKAKELIESSIALRVANQYWKLLTPEEQDQAIKEASRG